MNDIIKKINNLIRKIFPEYKSKKELKEEIETLLTDKQLANFYADRTKIPEIRTIKYNTATLKCYCGYPREIPNEKLNKLVRKDMARKFVEQIEQLIEIEEKGYDHIHDFKVFEGVLVVGKRTN